MEKIKRLLLVHVPVGKCNFKCPYCFIGQLESWGEYNEDIGYIDQPELIKKAFDRKRLGGTCFVNICAKGETLIYPQMIEVIRVILEQGHYVEVVTNGSLTKRFEEIAKFSTELLSRLEFKFSFHYTELKRLGLLESFFGNIKLMRQVGASFTLELTAVDEEENLIDEIKQVCMENVGAWCHITIARDDKKANIPVLSNRTLEEYYRVWSTFDSEMLSFKKRIFGENRREFCYAGDWSMYINLSTGEITKCYVSPKVGNLFDFSKPLPFEAIGECPIAHCYNGHALMAFGLLPDVETPVYADIRNRICLNGDEWLSPTVKKFFESKLIESNKEYSEKEKKNAILKTKKYIWKRKCYLNARRLVKRFFSDRK